MKQYPKGAVDHARDGALEWLKAEKNGYPRSWAQEAAETERRGYEMYDDFEAPPIAGYEALEREGLALRVGGATSSDGLDRVHFQYVDRDES